MVEPNSPLGNISIVLVETRKGGNIGAVARAMKNMGLRHLKLVRPCELESEECQKMAGKAIDLVTSAGVYPTLDEAVSQENLVIGTTSGRKRRKNQPIYSPREVASLVWNYGKSQRVALVFGPERRGLSDAQLARCQYLVSIPASPEYPVLNVAQAVMVLAYEIFIGSPTECDDILQLASHEERERMFETMEKVLVQVGFLSSQNPDHIMRSIRRFLGRADLTPRDVRIIRGMMSQMGWFIEKGHKLPLEKVQKP
ncbi:RNA methyltransferase [Acidobacteria bacterium AH-259-D05]|nr:RNA methyltransferase [Acidobacteria bacterium AH-259-D05]